MIIGFDGKAERPEGDGYFKNVIDEMNVWEQANPQVEIKDRRIISGSPGQFLGYISYEGKG